LILVNLQKASLKEPAGNDLNKSENDPEDEEDQGDEEMVRGHRKREERREGERKGKREAKGIESKLLLRCDWILCYHSAMCLYLLKKNSKAVQVKSKCEIRFPSPLFKI
jgi:hypothetical protein